MLTSKNAILVSLIAVLVAGCATTAPQQSSASLPGFTVDELLTRMPVEDSLEARWVFGTMLRRGSDGVVEVCKQLGPQGSEHNAKAEYALEGLATYVMGPGRESDRQVFVTGVGKALGMPMSVREKAFLLARLQTAGRREAVPVIAGFLGDERLCEPAAQALVAIRDGSVQPMLSAISTSTRSNRVTIIRSLGALGSVDAVEPLLREAASDDEDVRRAAQAALANIGDPRASQLLASAVRTASGRSREESAANYLLFADRLAEKGISSEAGGIAREISADPELSRESHICAAALDLLVRVEGEGALDELVASARKGDRQLRVAALRASERIPGNDATARWVSELPGFPPEVRADILTSLGHRGDVQAAPAVLESIIDPDSSVRHAAIDALPHLIGAEAVPSLLRLLRQSDAPGDIAAVRSALRQLPPGKSIPLIIPQLEHLEPPACVGLLDMLAGYGTLVPAEPVVALTRNKNASVRLAAVRALGSVATEAEQAELIAMLPGAVPDAEQSAIIDALVESSVRMNNSENCSARILTSYRNAMPSLRPVLLRALGRLGGSAALATVVEETRNKNSDFRDAAIRALADWPTIAAYDSLLAIAGGNDDLNRRVLALRGCVRVVEQSAVPASTAVRYHERTLAAARRADDRRLVIGALGNTACQEALPILVPYLKDETLALDAAMAAGKIAAAGEQEVENRKSLAIARLFIEETVPSTVRPEVARGFDARMTSNEPPQGFTALFNGKDLTGWKGLVENPVKRATMSTGTLAAAQAHADSSMRAHWSVEKGVLVFDGKGESLCTVKDYEDFELLVDWMIQKEGDSGIYLRGSPQVQIWDPAQWPEGSGGLYNNQKGPSKPMLRADNPIGQWNTFRIRMIGERVWVWLNNALVVDSVVLENYWDRSIPIFPTGQIELQSHNSPLFFRNIFIREIPRAPVFVEERLFNGRDLTGWELADGPAGSWGVSDGVLFTLGGAGGWLSTVRQYSSFQLDLDFRVPPGGNSGVFIRAPRDGDPAYTGMEIQVLDDYAAEYTTLKSWQYTGSVYGVQAPSVRATKKAGEWQHMQIIADGPRVKVTLNGQLVVDADLIAHMDQESTHPGLKRREGYIGLQNHGSRVEYRNITIRRLQ